jgi:exodeoxyribonuclease VII small subunit
MAQLAQLSSGHDKLGSGGARLLSDADFGNRAKRWASALEGGSFEETFQALGEAVEYLEMGNLALEDAIQCYEFGARLAEKCGHMLSEAELRVSRLDAELLQAAVTPGLFDDLESEEEN